jgi:competence ComEA-like helix-hairpin-helix protein
MFRIMRNQHLITLPFRFIPVWFLLLTATGSPAFAQQADTTRQTVEYELERILDELDSEEDYGDPETLMEFLEDLIARPVNINRAGSEELTRIPGIDLRMAREIIRYRDEQAPFRSENDLIRVPGIGQVTLERIRPFITVETRDLYANPRYWTENSRFETFSRYRQVVQQREGYQKPDSLGGYLGSPVNYYQRFRYSSRHLSLNLTQNKQPGEPLRGVDDFGFSSAHIALQNAGRLQALVIGDYSVGFGQGLLLWSGGSFGKGSDVIGNPVRNDRGIRPSSSARSSAAFRGIAASYGNRFQLSGFYSDRQRTASEPDEVYVRFPVETVYRRTVAERERADNLQEQTIGGRLRVELPNGHAGVSAFTTTFSRPVIQGEQPHQIYRFDGKTADGYSADLQWARGPVHLFGEAAYTGNRAFGWLGGTQLRPSPDTRVIISVRNYQPELRALFGAGFGEQSGGPSNEKGIYTALEHRIIPGLTLRGYLDLFRFPAARYQNHQPTSGTDRLARADVRPSSELSFFVQIRQKSREQEFLTNDAMGRELRQIGTEKRTNIRIHGEFQVHRDVRLRTRYDRVISGEADGSHSGGFLIFQDIRTFPVSGLRIDARLTFFDTDGYSSRVFQFENDLLYVMTNTMLFDRGQRAYILINYSPSDWLDLWMKVATTIYDNRTAISSGNQQIRGNRQDDIGIQARIRF